MIIVCVKEGL